MLDGFDFTILTFVLADIQRSFTVDNALAGALGTVTLMFRLVGGAAAGAAADRWGRKLPLILSIVWFSLFTVLSGFSTSYAMLFACRALFGIGMGGEWAAGMPLALEHLPDRMRGPAAGILQGAWAWGYILSALVFQTLYPVFRERSAEAWRAMFWVGALPALLVLWIRAKVSESPIWVKGQRDNRVGKPKVSLARIFGRDLLGTTIHCSVLAAGFMVSYYSVTYWYATFLQRRGLNTLPYVVALNAGGILGSAFWGGVSEGRLGPARSRHKRRRARSRRFASLLNECGLADSADRRAAGRLRCSRYVGGLSVIHHGAFSERRPRRGRRILLSRRRAGGLLHLLGNRAPGRFRLDPFAAMTTSIALSGLAVSLLIWLGPETRGRTIRSW